MRSVLVLLILLALSSSVAHATTEKNASKDQSAMGIVMFWPRQDNAVLKLTFSPFQNLASYGGKTTLQSDVIVQNLSAKLIPKASFTVSLLDKDRVAVGSGTLIVNDLSPGALAQVQFQCESVGTPAMLSLSARNNGGAPISVKTIPMTVISVPAGASLKVDDKDEGLTPANINVSAGTHQLVLTKEGFAVATTPLEVAPDEAPGGSITITLGGLSNDMIELRDGSIITGDIISMTLQTVVVDVQGQQQKLDRNRIRKIYLVERTVTTTVVGTKTPDKETIAPSSPTPHP